jgi:hypothetical protein
MEINKNNLKTPEERKLYDDYSYFVYGLVRQYEPKTTFEIGLGPTANTTCAIVQALFENSQNNGVVGHHYVLELEPADEAKKKIAKLPQDFFTLRIGDSKEATKYCNLKHGMIDILLVDGNHTTEYCFNDTMLPIMTNNFNMESGIIIFHDAQMATVRQAILALKDKLNLATFFFPKISVAVAKIKF